MDEYEGVEFDYYQTFLDGFIGYLSSHLTETDWEKTSRYITQTQQTLNDQNQSMVIDPASENHIQICSLVLAAYRVLSETYSNKTVLLPLIQDAFTKPFDQYVHDATTSMLEGSDDPLADLAAISKHKEEQEYGEGFEFKRERDDDYSYTLIVNKCFYHQFFAVNGSPELTAVFCASDESWAQAIDPKRYGVRFERPTTIGLGGNHCRFQFTKVTG